MDLVSIQIAQEETIFAEVRRVVFCGFIKNVSSS